MKFCRSEKFVRLTKNDKRKIRRWFMNRFNSNHSFIVDYKQYGPVTAARKRGINRKIARFHYGLKSKKHASRFVEVTF